MKFTSNYFEQTAHCPIVNCWKISWNRIITASLFNGERKRSIATSKSTQLRVIARLLYPFKHQTYYKRGRFNTFKLLTCMHLGSILRIQSNTIEKNPNSSLLTHFLYYSFFVSFYRYSKPLEEWECDFDRSKLSQFEIYVYKCWTVRFNYKLKAINTIIGICTNRVRNGKCQPCKRLRNKH